MLSRSFAILRAALAAILTAMGWLASGPLTAQTLSQVVEMAVSSNPDVVEALSQWEARGEELRQAQAGYLPVLDLTAGIGYEYTDSPGTRAGGDGTAELERAELGLTARQMLFDGHGTSSEVSRQQARRDAQAARVRSVAEDVGMQATQAYVDLLRFSALKALAEQALEVHLRIQDQIRLRSEAGVGRRADYDQVNARVALAEANLVAAEVNLRDAETTFKRVVGTLPQGEYAAPSIAAGTLPGSLQEALQIARARNPVLDTAEADIRAAHAQHDAAKQANYPRLDLEVGGNLNDNIDGVAGYSNDLSAMLRMRYNLYRGGADAARVRQTAYNINEAQEVRNRALRQLEESLRLAWAAQQATAAQLPLQQRQVEAALATRDAYAKQFNIGQRTLLDLLNSENEVLEAQQSVANTRADLLLAQYRILQAMGGLLQHLGLPSRLTAAE